MPAPANDDLGNALPISVGVSGSQSIADATVESGETAIFGTWSDGAEKSVWFEYAAPADGVVSFDIMECDLGPLSNPIWHVCQGTGWGDLTIVDGPYQGGSDAFHFDVAGGQIYLIRVAVTQEASTQLTWRLRGYEWSAWTDPATPEYVNAPEALSSIVITQGYVAADQANVSWTATTTNAERAAWFTSNMAAMYSAAQAIYDGVQDDFFTPPNSGTGALLQPFPAFAHDATATGKVVGGLSRTGQLDFTETADVTVLFANAVETYPDTPTIQYEHSEAMPVAAHVELDWNMNKTIQSDIFTGFTGLYSIVAYVPTTADRDVLDPAYTTHTILGPTSVSDGATGSATLDLAEADFAPSENGYAHGIVFYGQLQTTPPTISGSVGSGNHTNSAHLFANGVIDATASFFTFRRPRYRMLSALPLPATGPPPPRLLYPRTDDLGIGIGRIYPPPNTQQYGRRLGSGAPV